jgi:ABC-type glycerol-3-phosphate transport system permease component
MTHEQTSPAPFLRQNRTDWRYTLGKVFFYLAITLLAAFVAMPFLWMISTSLKSKEE